MPWRREGVRLTMYGDSVGLGSLLDLQATRRFTQDTGVAVRVIPRAPSANETFANYQRLFQAQSPDVDVLMVDVIWPGALAPHLLDLKPALGHLTAGHFPAIVANDTVEGRLVAMPWFADGGLLYYRTDLLARYGYTRPPASWDELERMARTVQDGERARGQRRFTGFVWQGNTYEGLTCNALEWQVSMGAGDFFTPAGQLNVTTPKALAAFTRAAGWVGTISPPGVTSYQEEDSRNVFQSGNALFMRNWPYAYAAGNSPGSPVRGRFAATVLPKTPDGRTASTLGGWQLSVSRYTRHPEAAIELVRYLSSPDVQKWRAMAGSFLPTIRPLYDDAELLAAQPVARIMPEVLANAVARPSTRTGELCNEVSTIYYQGVAEILQGNDPELAARRMQRDLDLVLQSE